MPVIPLPADLVGEVAEIVADSVPTSLDTPAAQAQALAAGPMALPEAVVASLTGAASTATPLGVGVSPVPPPPATVAKAASSVLSDPADEGFPTPAESPVSIAHASQANGDSDAPRGAAAVVADAPAASPEAPAASPEAPAASPEAPAEDGASASEDGASASEDGTSASEEREAVTQAAPVPPAGAVAATLQAAGGKTSHQAVRVAVSRAPAANGLYQLHRLSEGESLPAGWTEALLVALTPGELFDA